MVYHTSEQTLYKEIERYVIHDMCSEMEEKHLWSKERQEEYRTFYGLCVEEFTKRHGSDHNKYLWSKIAFKNLVEKTLHPKRFRLSFLGYLEIEDISGGLNCNTAKYIALIDHSNIVWSLYPKIKSSNVPSIARRVSKVNGLWDKTWYDIREYDTEYKAEFLDFVLAKHRHKKEDYRRFQNFMKEHFRKKKQKESMNTMAELALYSCTIS